MDVDSCRPGSGPVRPSFDEYGFAVGGNGEDSSVLDDTHRCHVYSPQPSAAVAESWRLVCRDWGRYEKDSPHKLRQLLRKGIPTELRSKVWQLFLNSHTLKAQSSFDYQASLTQFHSQLNTHNLTDQSSESNVRLLNTMLEEATCEEEEEKGQRREKGGGRQKEEELVSWIKNTRQIMMDIIRTFPSHQLYMGDTPTKCSLLHILMIYVEYNPSVGYCQGMAYVAALLLMYMTEEDTFWALVSLFERPKYLTGYYDPSLSKIKTHADVFGLLLREKQPELAKHMESLGVHPLMYVTSWFMCLFTTLPCWDTVLTICDLIFLEGINTIFRAALAIMEVCSPELLAMYEIGQVLPFLQKLPIRLISHQNLSRVIWQSSVHSWEVELYQDVVFRDLENDRLSRLKKRPAPNEEQTPRPAKRRKASTEEEQPPSVGQSFLSRIVSAITPAKLTRVIATPVTSIQPGSRVGGRREPAGPPSTQASATQMIQGSNRARSTASHDKEKGQAPTFKTPSRPGRGGALKHTLNSTAEIFEMQEFSAIRRRGSKTSTTSSGSDYVDFQAPSTLPSPCPSSASSAAKTKSAASPPSGTDTSSLRRSVRIARRRSFKQTTFPSLSVLPLRSERPLQDQVQTTNHPKEHHAFRVFSTPTPLRSAYQHKRQRSSTSTSPSSKTKSPGSAASPEVELGPVKKRRREDNSPASPEVELGPVKKRPEDNSPASPEVELGPVKKKRPEDNSPARV